MSAPLHNEVFRGLLVRVHSGSWAPLPLRSVDVSARSFDFCSEVTVKQTYVNTTENKIEAEYTFPLDENSAVCGFSCDLDGRRIHGIVKEKSQALKEFNQAKSQGKSTMLLEQKQENIFKIRIGNLTPHSLCEVTLTYITTLDLQGSANRMIIPAVVAPRYTPQSYYGYQEVSAASELEAGEVLSEESAPEPVAPSTSSSETKPKSPSFFQRMTAKLRGKTNEAEPEQTNSIIVKQKHVGPQRFSMKIEVAMPSEITTIVSESHQSQIKVQVDPIIGAPDSNGRLSVPHTATILFGMNADGTGPSELPESLDSRDFVLIITQKQYLEARAVIEVDPETGSQAVQLAFCPQTLDLMDASSLQIEIIFLIDQSGSMSGSGIEAVRSCLGIFLRSLPVACKFNLVSFGSNYRKLFPHSQAYSESSITAALDYASKIDADLGGTEILAPLQDCFTTQRSIEYPREIFLLTDGQVSNTQQLVDLTRANSHHARLFTFGLGDSVDRHLVKTLAAAGRGEAEFASTDGPSSLSNSKDASQGLNAKVMRSLIRAMQPSLSDVRVDWSAAMASTTASSSTETGMIQCPETIVPIFPPNRKIIYALGGSRAPAPSGDKIVHVVVSAQSNRPTTSGDGVQGRVSWSIPLDLGRPLSGGFVHKLAARARISEIQNATNTMQNEGKAEVLKLALKYQLLSNYTSFLIVDDRKDGVSSESNMETSTKPDDAQVESDDEDEDVDVNGPVLTSSSYSFQQQQKQSAPVRSIAMPSASASSRGGVPSLARKCKKAQPMMMVQSSMAPSADEVVDELMKEECESESVPMPTLCMSAPCPPPPPCMAMPVACAAPCPPPAASAPMMASKSMPMPMKKRECGPPAGASGGSSSHFTDLVQMSCIDGTWNLTPELVSLIQSIGASQSAAIQSSLSKLSVDSLTALATSLSLTPKAIATLLALWTFKTCFASQSAEWAIMAGKAKGQLRNTLSVPVDQIDTITTQIIA